MKVKMLKNKMVKGKPCMAGKTVTVSDADCRILLGSKSCEVVQTKAEKAKADKADKE